MLSWYLWKLERPNQLHNFLTVIHFQVIYATAFHDTVFEKKKEKKRSLKKNQQEVHPLQRFGKHSQFC